MPQFPEVLEKVMTCVNWQTSVSQGGVVQELISWVRDVVEPSMGVLSPEGSPHVVMLHATK